MEIKYRIYENWTQSHVSLLANAGFKAKEGGSELFVNAEQLELIKNLIPDNLFYLPRLYFSNEEVNSAELLLWIGPTKTLGYPQPEDSYRDIVYSNSVCKHCHRGYVQINPFKIKNIPKWKKYKMFRLTWVNEACFTHIDIFQAIFKQFNIDYWPVIYSKTGKVLQDTVQLKLATAPCQLIMPDDIEKKYCKYCKQFTYLGYLGFFPKFEYSVNQPPIFLTQEYFGEGLDKSQEIIITQELRQLLIKHKLASPYSSFQPVKN